MKGSGGHNDIEITMNMSVKGKVAHTLAGSISYELVAELERTCIIPENHWYGTEISASAYEAAQKMKSEGYSVSRNVQEALDEHKWDIIEYINNQITEWKNSKDFPFKNRLDFVSLGAGDGNKESTLLKHLLNDQQHKNTHVDIIPVDWSYQLLVHTAENMKQIADSHQDNTELSPRITDFDKEGEPFGKNQYQFITALGVLHNPPLGKRLNVLQKIMKDNSIMLCDINILPDKVIDQNELTKIENDYKNIKEFFALPLRSLINASQVCQEKSLVDKLEKYKNIQYDRDNITVQALSNDQIHEYIDQYDSFTRATESTLFEEQFSKGFKKTVTVVITYENQDQKDEPTIVLGYSKRYDLEEAKQAINDAMLRRIYDIRFNDSMLFLLTNERRKPDYDKLNADDSIAEDATVRT